MTFWRWQGLVAAAALSVPLAAGCGGDGAFPEAEPCTAPTATPTRSATPPRGDPDRRYRELVRTGLVRVESMTTDFRLTWPYERPSSRQDFRQAFVVYARDLTCLAADLRALEPSTAQLEAFDTRFDEAMTKTIEVTEFGREAVRTRNTSKFKDWIKEVEALPALYDTLDPLLNQR